jgi:hypothetical protein
MKKMIARFSGLLVAAITVFGCATTAPAPGWTTLIDGPRGLENFDRLGDANWRVEGDYILADKGKGGFLVTKASYRDFEIRAEFWAETDTNSGIFFRVSNPGKIGADSSYEANIWDIRPEPKYGTGAIVDVAEVPVPIANKAGGRWNTYEITAKGSRLTMKLNGVQTVNVDHGKWAEGPFALQFANGVKGAPGGPIKWRKVQVRPL